MSYIGYKFAVQYITPFSRCKKFMIFFLSDDRSKASHCAFWISSSPTSPKRSLNELLSKASDWRRGIFQYMFAGLHVAWVQILSQGSSHSQSNAKQMSVVFCLMHHNDTKLIVAPESHRWMHPCSVALVSGIGFSDRVQAEKSVLHS